jgi:hypothetical protein
MISDVLFEAAEEIRRYQREMPEIYDSMKPAIEPLLSEIERARMRLDTPLEYSGRFTKQGA